MGYSYWKRGPRVKNAQRQEYNGIWYHSKKEAGYAAELDLRKKAGDIKNWERQIKIPLNVNGHHIANYYVDFRVERSDGVIEYTEVKGFETEVWRLKWKLFEALIEEIEPGAELVVVK